MKHEDFSIGREFYTATGKWRCTDIGTRTVTAIHIGCVELAHGSGTDSERIPEDLSGFNGPPYAVAEHVFDEFDMAGCSLDVVSN